MREPIRDSGRLRHILQSISTLQPDNSCLSDENFYLNDFHRRNSMAAQREVLRMRLRPYSREQKIVQIQSIKEGATSKSSANAERSKLI
jgi:hypothetical protein